MANDKNNMDNFLRESLGNLSANPSQSVWKGLTKRLIILELLRLNFTNIGKTWLYSGLATVATISGLTYFGLTHQTEEKTQTASTPQTEQTTNKPKQKETFEIVSLAKETESISEATTTNNRDKIIEENKLNQKLNNKETTNVSIKEEKLNKKQEAVTSISSIGDHKTNEPAQNLPGSISGIPIKYLPETNNHVSITGIGRAQMVPYTMFDVDEEPTKSKNKSKNFNWYLGVSYNPEWPLSNEDMYVNNHQFAINAGIEYKKWMVNIGVGLRTEKTPSMYTSNFMSYDSVGYFYDIDYYEINPINPDSITIYYTTESLYDSVAHRSDSHGPDQIRRWIFIPISLGYQVYESSNYQLYANIFGQFGWQTYLEKSDMNLQLASGSTMEDVTPEANPNYLQLGLGLENNFNIDPHWSIYAEPRINYYVNTPYSINQTSGNGPYSFGIKLGVKYKFKRR